MLPARNRQSALPLGSPTSWQDKFSVSLEFSSRIPRSRVHMEQSSLAVSHGGDTEHTRAHMHTCPCTHAHTLGRFQVFLGLLAACSYPQGLDSAAGERCTQIGQVGGGRGKGLNGPDRHRCGARTKEAMQAGADLRNAAGGAAGAVAGPAWAGSSARAQPVPTRAGAQSCSHPFPWAVVHCFRNSHDPQHPKWPSPSAS